VGAPALPGRIKNRRNLQGKVVSAPQAEQESFLLVEGDLDGGNG